MPKKESESELQAFERVLQLDKSAWADEMRAKHEKYSMYVASLTVARDAIALAQGRLNNGETSKEGAVELLEGAKEVLGPFLGETVSSGTIQISEADGAARRDSPRPRRGLASPRIYMGDCFF